MTVTLTPEQANALRELLRVLEPACDLDEGDACALHEMLGDPCGASNVAFTLREELWPLMEPLREVCELVLIADRPVPRSSSVEYPCVHGRAGICALCESRARRLAAGVSL